MKKFRRHSSYFFKVRGHLLTEDRYDFELELGRIKVLAGKPDIKCSYGNLNNSPHFFHSTIVTL